MARIAGRGIAVALLALLLAACGSGGDGSPSPSPSPSPAATDAEVTALPSVDLDAPVVVTFEVADDQRYKVLLTDPADIRIAHGLLAGDEVPSIPNGRIIKDQTGVNEGYSWSIDPEDIEFADVTIEVCDGLPSDVEQGVITSDRYCPWSATLVDLERAP